jgi:hypothetical protein
MNSMVLHTLLLCLALLAVGLLALYFVLLHFFRRGKQEDEREREFQREMMRKIDTVLFPTIEQLVAQGMEVPPTVAKN